MAQLSGSQPQSGPYSSPAESFQNPVEGFQSQDEHVQTWDAMETYFECITTCSLDDGACVTRCVEQLRETP